MQKTGKIVGITPDGSYQSQNGMIYTFQMTVQCGAEVVTGQIGSKSQVYPLGVGQDITVEMTNTEHGVRLKKINAQYAAQNATQGQQAPPKQSGSKDRLIVTQVAYKALQAGVGCDETLLRSHVDMIMRVGSGQPAPAPTTDPNYIPPDDDIPF